MYPRPVCKVELLSLGLMPPWQLVLRLLQMLVVLLLQMLLLQMLLVVRLLQMQLLLMLLQMLLVVEVDVLKLVEVMGPSPQKAPRHHRPPAWVPEPPASQSF